MADFTSLNGYNVKDAVSRAYGPRIDALEAEHLHYELRNIYVDGATGSDSNDGSKDYPYQTLERALDEVEKGYLNIAVKLMSAGVYTTNRGAFTGFSWHMTSHASGVFVQFTGRASSANNKIVFYGNHVNWGVKDEYDQQDYYGFTVQFSVAEGMYQDSGYCLFRNVNFTKRYTAHGGELTMIGCHVSSVQTDRTLADLRDMDVNSYDGNNYVFDFSNSSLVNLSGTLTLADVIGTKQAFLRVVKSILIAGISGGIDLTGITLPAAATYFGAAQITSSASTKTALLTIGLAQYSGPTSGLYSVNTWNTTVNAQP